MCDILHQLVTAGPKEIGVVQYIRFEMWTTTIEVYYDPPEGVPWLCDVTYAVVYLLDGEIVHESTTNELTHSFNFVEERLFCKLVEVQVQAIVDGILGDADSNNIVTGIL